MDETQEHGSDARPSGELVDIHLESHVPAAGDMARSLNRWTDEGDHP